jgi:hypothetical protein
MTQKEKIALPKSLELEQWKRAVERRSNWMLAVCAAMSLGCLAVSYVAVGRDIALVVVDQDGRPNLYKSSEAAKWQTDDLRVE